MEYELSDRGRISDVNHKAERFVSDLVFLLHIVHKRGGLKNTRTRKNLNHIYRKEVGKK